MAISFKVINDLIKGSYKVLSSGLVTAKRVLLVANNDEEISVQNPIPADGDSVYVKDIDTDNSDNYNFTGSVTDYFDSLKSVNNDTTANNPKQIKVWFKRTVYASDIGLGCDDLAGTFSNIKLELLGSGAVVRYTLDNSSDSTKLNSKLLSFAPQAFNGFILSFATTDSICLSNITVRKEVKVNSILQALKPDGTAVFIGATNSGNLKTANVEDGLAIAKGDVTDTTFIHKFGNTPDFDQGDGVVTVWDGADDANINQMVYQYSSTADIDRVSSSSASDTFDIEVQGLDTNYALVSQTVTLTGQTPVALTTNLIRVFRMVNQNSSDNVGHIYCFVNSTVTGGVPNDSTKVRAVIQPGYNQTLMAIYTVPAGQTGYLRDWFASIAGSNKTSNYVIQLRKRPFGKVFQLKHLSSLADGGTSYIQHKYNEPEVFEEKSDIEMRVKLTAAGATAASVSSGFDLVLINN